MKLKEIPPSLTADPWIQAVMKGNLIAVFIDAPAKRLLCLLMLMFSLTGFLSAGGQIETEPKGWAPLPQAQTQVQEGSPQQLFDPSGLPSVLLRFPLVQYNQLLADFDRLPSHENYVVGSLSWVDGERRADYPLVGLRLRGNEYSRNRPEVGTEPVHLAGSTVWQKAHFRVNIDKFNTEEEFFGLETFNLKMFNGDPAYVREVYAMDLFRRFGVPTATRIRYVRLYLYVEGDQKPVYFGVYRLNESLDEDFLKDRFPNNHGGFLWKCLYPAALNDKDPGAQIGIEDPEQMLRPAYDLKTREKDFETAKAQLALFIRNLNTLEGEAFETWAQRHIQIDTLLRATAVSAALGSWDDYWGNQNNFYLYLDEQERAHFIPYDYDNILGNTQTQDMAMADPFDMKFSGGSRPLIERFLAIPRYRAQYAGYLRELIDPARGLLDPQASDKRIQEWKALVEASVPNDVFPEEILYDGPADWSTFDGNRLLGDEGNFFSTRIDTLRHALLREGF